MRQIFLLISFAICCNVIPSTISVEVPMKLRVELKGAAKRANARFHSEGIYTLVSGRLVNGKSYWKQEHGPNALWFGKQNSDWNIGYKDYLGHEDNANIYSNAMISGPLVGPHETTAWNYFDELDPIQTSHLVVVSLVG